MNELILHLHCHLQQHEERSERIDVPQELYIK